MAPILGLLSCQNGAGNADAKQDTSSTTTTSATIAATEPGGIHEENLTVSADTTNLQCFVAYKNDSSKKAIVLVVPEWWGLTDYPKSRARQLADLGYLAVAVDVFGNGAIAADPGQAKAMTEKFYKDPQVGVSRLQAVLAKARTLPQADTSRIAAIGYCFGGTMVLNAASLGVPLDAVVSFHGGLSGVAPFKKAPAASILICHGLADSFVPAQDVAAFRKQLDKVKAHYVFDAYPGATHAFTNPASDENGKKFHMPIAYNKEADEKSWNDMKNFFSTELK